MSFGDYEPEQIEEKWQQYWVENETYAYKGSEDRDAVFSIDTPPPTVSGHLHMGHLYGFTLQDFAARFRRMMGKDVFYPFGYDDNGIASERLTERELGIEHQNFTRREFQEKCREVCQQYESEFTEKMQALAYSMDWNNTYKTIEPRVQRISQLSFIDLYEQGREYRQKAPAIWCPDCETAISQVETEDKEKASHFNDIRFPLVDDSGNSEGVSVDRANSSSSSSEGDLTIATTRPELLPACVAIFVHPEDEEHQYLVGKHARVPLFGQEVPIIEDERVDMETGSGIVMCCTFGDQTDIEWYQAHDLPLRIAIDESGTMTEQAEDYEGMSTEEARDAIVEELDAEGYLIDSRDITHTVQVHERCEHDVEFMVSKQWYIEILDHKDKYLEAGQEMDWYPEKMFTRYKHWIEGLQWDWLISRQRDSGIPFPVWYCTACEQEVLADREQLPVDPIQDEPPVDTCPECGYDEFEPEEDVLDTWATSSLTPLINARWDWDDEAGDFVMERPELYPMNVRPQGHDIISFWLFHTVVKCLEHTGEVPFDSVMINGHVLDENWEKMSKSKGNVVTPDEVLEQFPVDAARYWAAGAAVGDDFPYKEKDLVTGQKLMRKLWNASKLVDMLTPEHDLDEPEELDAIDEWLLAEMDENIAYITEQLDDYKYAKARNRLREFFWNVFCDNYLEIAKQRLDEEDNLSAQYTLQQVHRRFLKLFAPFLVHITEELWNTMYEEDGSIHTEAWPEPLGVEADLDAGEAAMEIIHGIRKYKTDNQMAPTDPVPRVEVYGPDVSAFADAIRDVMHIEEFEQLDARPEMETTIEEIKLNYAVVGPKYGDQVSAFEEAISGGDYAIREDELVVSGETLSDDEFEVHEETSYAGNGEMIETENFVIIVL